MKAKRIISMIMVFVFVISVFTVPTSAMAKKKKPKMIKVKKATYEKYKKAYKELNNANRKLALKQADYEDAMDQYEIAMEECEKWKKLASARTTTTNNSALQEQIDSLKIENEHLKAQLKEKQYKVYTQDEYDTLNEEKEDALWLNQWLWDNINSMGITYANKTWTIPAELPDKYIINGTTYKVIVETTEE